MMQYKMIQVPPDVSITAAGMLGRAPDSRTAAAQYLETIVNGMASEGWEFFRVDTIGITSSV